MQFLLLFLIVDSKTLKEEKREELFENLKSDPSLGWEVDIIDPRDLSAKMLQRFHFELKKMNKINKMTRIWLIINFIIFWLVLDASMQSGMTGNFSKLFTFLKHVFTSHCTCVSLLKFQN